MRVLCCSLASPGFLYPCIAIGRELRKRGDQVAFVTDLGCSPLIEDAGFERLPRGPRDGNSFLVPQWGEPLAILLQVKHIEYAIARFQPDVLIGQHLTFGPLLAKERLGIPVGLLGSVTFLWPVEGRKFIQPVSEDERRKAWRFTEMINTYQQARRLLRLGELPDDADCNPLLSDLFMIRSVPELEINDKPMPQNVRLIGACLWEDPEIDLDLRQWMCKAVHKSKPIMYVHQGRFFQFAHFWPQLMNVTEHLGISVAASTATMDCPEGEVPATSFLRPHVPQSQVLQKANIAVLSANATAVLGALSAGVPALLIPAGGEQPDIAETCLRAGVARVVEPDHVTEDRLRREIEILMHDSLLREAVQRIRNAMCRVNSAETVVDLLRGIMANQNRAEMAAVSLQKGCSP